MCEAAANFYEDFFKQQEVVRPHPYTDAPVVEFDNEDEKIPEVSIDELLDTEKLTDILEKKENLTIYSKELLIILNNFHNDRILIENSLNEYQIQREILYLRTVCEHFILSSIDDKIWRICNPSYACKVSRKF
ncbi:unnamed protein product [Rotaria sp. Silwood1]|nr:unnamed protein product [Rotaria sp. Silwood1]CAF4686693.1 unnamed protein product [Rotaria sp. Silwood1]